MSNSKFNALASLALLAAAPLAAQADMVEMTETELTGVVGQGPIANLIDVLTPGPADPGSDAVPGTFVCTGTYSCTFTPYVPAKSGTPDEFIGTMIAGAIGETAGDATQGAIGFGLLPFTGPINALFSFNNQVLDNSADFGAGVADIAFYGPFSALDLAAKILAAPVNFVFGPINRYVDGVTGRVQATVDGAAYAFTEVKGTLITNAFAGASAAAGNNGLNFTSRVFGRIAQAQAGLTTNRLEAIASPYGF